MISGSDGVGKSELARKYARSHYSKEDSVIWINAETQETLKESFHRLAKEKLKLIIKDVKSIVDNVCGYLADGKRIFIFDNAYFVNKLNCNNFSFEIRSISMENVNKNFQVFASYLTVPDFLYKTCKFYTLPNNLDILSRIFRHFSYFNFIV